MAATEISSAADVRFPVTGLMPAVVQDADTGQVLMLGYMGLQA
jgi:phosphoribosyl-ATP pyrophosphohydrolase/phosphoribosyl-AMP cyclohydrolase